MELKLEKQKVTRLSSEDMSEINGGGRRRSNNNNGGCNYSRNNPYEELDINGVKHTLSCLRKSAF